MYNYEEIRDKLKEYRYVVFSVKDNKEFNMILRFDGTNRELREEIADSFKKFDKPNYFFVVFRFSFHTGTKPLQGGPLAVTLSTLKFIDNKIVDAYKYNDVAKRFMNQIWFSKKLLEEKGWNDNYFNIIIQKLLAGKVKLYPLVTNKFNVQFLI